MTVLLALMLVFSGNTDGEKALWPMWRGADGTGSIVDAKPPVSWSETENIAWKIPISGFGLATPIIWGDHLYLLTAEDSTTKAEHNIHVPPELAWAKSILPEYEQRFRVMCLDRHTGKLVWEQTATQSVPHEAIHGDSSWASSSPVTDGTALIASFGSAGIFCFEMDGKLRWKTDLGNMSTRKQFGEGSSPALWGDTVVVNWDHEEQSFIVALDKNTGELRWKVLRNEVTSWSTPVITEVNGKPQVIVSATERIRAYDLADGSEIWSCGGMTVNTIPTPIIGKDTVYTASGYRGNAVIAIALNGTQGDITDTDRVRWKLDRDAPYVPSPALSGDALYFLKHSKGIISRVNVSTGKLDFGPERLEGLRGVYSSLVAAGGHIYIIGRHGSSVVIEDSPTFKVVSTNQLDERFDASPAIAGNAIYLRGHHHLYCIGKP